ncbi:MAG: S8 family peptidase [Geothrix sp.]|nr:S8 family peptidase [Geothrix sp.]
MAEGPIQVVLNTDSFRVVRERPPGGSNKDFFAGHDEAFVAHKQRLLDQINGAVAGLSSQSGTQVGVVKVVLRSEGIAKSHRPVRALFRLEKTPILGGIDFGQLLFKVNPNSLAKIGGTIDAAEATTNWQEDPKSKKVVAKPSRSRSEVGAIERIELYGASDKRGFSAVQAIEWLQDPRTGGAYHVDLFQRLIPRESWDQLEDDDLGLQRSFIEGIETLGLKLRIHPIGRHEIPKPTLSIRLELPSSTTSILYQSPLRTSGAGGSNAGVEVERDASMHDHLLGFLDGHPLVRSIRLPGKLKSADVSEPPSGSLVTIPDRLEGATYPKIGIIDGGTSGVLSKWIVGAWDLLAKAHKSPDHGTFIGGLLVVGEPLNGLDVVLEAGACDLVDIAIVPREDQPHLFAEYFRNGITDFLDEVEAAVQECKARYGVRIFNFSLNIDQPISLSQYSEEAARLDQISDEHDVLIFVSAGNLNGGKARSEWSSEPIKALAQLAASREDGVLIPAESVRNLTVGSLNPPGALDAIPHAPASYTRRGPGPGAIVKPDLVHVGGAGAAKGLNGHGLFSLSPGGQAVSSCGTSFATPLVAKTAAVLQQSIEGEISRETLKALLIHNAIVPGPLQDRAFHDVARHLVGFGMPRPAKEILEGNAHEITLVFASRLHFKQELIFPFQWPISLVSSDGKCSGEIRATLVYSPPLDHRYGAEFVRVNLEANLRQENGQGQFRRQVPPAYLPKDTGDDHHLESTLVEHGLKWSPVKIYHRFSEDGHGSSSSWRLVVDYLERAEAKMPDEGVPFTCIVTISDPSAAKPVFNEMRQGLQTLGVRLENIQIAARITPRI